MRFSKIVWSPCEVDYLKKHREDTPVNQLSVYLAKSRNAIKNKLNELDGKGSTTVKKNKKSYIGKRKDLGISCRSSWEANVLRYFDHIGWKWLYEPKVFPFLKERRGAISYLPDVYLPEYDTYVEIKGFLDSKSRGAIRKFKKYYPNEFSRMKAIVGSPKTKAAEFFNKMGVEILFYYNNVNRDFRKIIENWE